MLKIAPKSQKRQEPSRFSSASGGGPPTFCIYTQDLRNSPGRLLKHLAATGTVYEVGPNEYLATPLSMALKDPIYSDQYPAMFVRPNRHWLQSAAEMLTSLLLGLRFVVLGFQHCHNIFSRTITRILATRPMVPSSYAMIQRATFSSGCLSVPIVSHNSGIKWLAMERGGQAGWILGSILWSRT